MIVAAAADDHGKKAEPEPAGNGENADGGSGGPGGKKNGGKEEEEAEEQTSVTRHRGTFAGEAMNYTATAGTIVLKKNEEKPHASVFYVAYTKDAVDDPAERAICFCFNGGPGSSSIWLHLGGLGPRRVQMNADGTQPAPPYRLGENPNSLLAVADLVFIDPVSTGFSRAEKGEKASDFHGFDEDLNSVAEFIRLYTTRGGRWLSPKFLAGESYGAFRAAGLSQVLQDRYGMFLNGIVLVSGLLDFETLRGGDLSQISFLPGMAAVAAYHGKLADEVAADPARLRAEVEAFAKGEYAEALLLGAGLDGEKRSAVAAKLARFTGLDAKLIERLDLRLSPSRFRKELLRDEGVVIGRFDARIKGDDADKAGIYPGADPSYSAVYGAYSATMKDYVRRDLEFESDLVYEVLTGKVRPWNFDKFAGSYVTVSNKLASALTENPYLQVLVACGNQDLATPYFGIQHSIDHLRVDPKVLDRVRFTFYEGGHMMYTIEDSNKQLNEDIAAFVLKASNNDG